MPSAGFAVLDDIATMLKHSGTLAAAAAKKTGPLVGDDLAVNAEAMLGINPNRELAIVGQVAKGSAINKVWLIGAGLGLSAIAPGLIPPLLAAGGAFLCYEGYHKTFDKHHDKHAEDAELINTATQDSTEALLALEKKKISKAITTDVILSAEIIAITLGTVAGATFGAQLATLALVGAAMTVGVYGAVAGLVKLDDLALLMMKNTDKGPLGKAIRGTGEFALKHGVPGLMKVLSVAGTAAMFVVGGEILMHSVPAVHHAVEHALHMLPHVPGLSMAAGWGLGLAAGVAAGFVTSTAWKVAGPTIAKVAGVVAKPLAPVVDGLKNMNPFKKKAAPTVEATTPAPAIPAVEPAAPLTEKLPTPKQDLAAAVPKTEPAATKPADNIAQTLTTSQTLNTNRRL